MKFKLKSCWWLVSLTMCEALRASSSELLPGNQSASHFRPCRSVVKSEKKFLISKSRKCAWLVATYRHVCRWKAQHVENHRVHDAAHFWGRLAVPHSRLRKGWIKQNAVRTELVKQLLPQLDAFFDVTSLLRRANQAACGVIGEEPKSVERVLGAANYRFS